MCDDEPLWTHEETAKYLKVSPWTLHHLVSQGEGPPVYRVGRNRRYDPPEVRAWLRGGTTATATETTGTDRAGAVARRPGSVGDIPDGA